MFSIITVNYNNLNGLKRTVESVLMQRDAALELIVIDGGSSDGSLTFLREIKDIRFSFVSESDEGIYDAMNKGISKSNGNWLLFMNSGDCFCNSSVLLSVTKFDQSTNGANILYGDKITESGSTIKASEDIRIIEQGELFACHQCIFFRPNITYDLSYKIFGDFNLLAQLYNSVSHSSIKYLDIPIAIYEGGGVSSKISTRKRVEKFRSLTNNFGFIKTLNYYLLNKKNLVKLVDLFRFNHRPTS